MKNRVCEALGIEKPVLAASMNWLSDAINSITDIKTCKEVIDELASAF